MISVILLALILFSTANGLNYEKRIVNGVLAKDGEFKYMVSVQNGRSHVCGGCTLGSKYILTAAHCLYNEKNNQLNIKRFRILAGRNELQSYQKGFYSWVDKAYIHEEYNDTSHDIAILRLVNPFPYEDYNISTIPLNSLPVVSGSPCTISGWGVQNFEESDPTNALRTTNVTLMDNPTCQEKYKKGNISLEGNVVCAGDNETDSCQGDSGGPLVCNGTVTGLVSGGIECAHYHYPGIYTDVSKYINWIKNTIQMDNSSEDTSKFSNFPNFIPMPLPGMFPSQNGGNFPSQNGNNTINYPNNIHNTSNFDSSIQNNTNSNNFDEHLYNNSSYASSNSSVGNNTKFDSSNSSNHNTSYDNLFGSNTYNSSTDLSTNSSFSYGSSNSTYNSTSNVYTNNNTFVNTSNITKPSIKPGFHWPIPIHHPSQPGNHIHKPGKNCGIKIMDNGLIFILILFNIMLY